MCTVIDLDAERAKRGKLRGMTQAELAMYRHDGDLAERQAERKAAMQAAWLQRIADQGDYDQDWRFEF